MPWHVSDPTGRLTTNWPPTSSYVSRVLHLAFLAPDIVQRIASGHSPQLNARQLIRQVPLPIDWTQQRELLGVDR